MSKSANNRNQPCHCGSGKKYKVCHGGTDQRAALTGTARVALGRRLRVLDQRIKRDIEAFAIAALGEEGLFKLTLPLYSYHLESDTELGWAQLLPSYLFHTIRPSDGLTLRDRYIAARGDTLAAEDRDWLAAHARAWWGLWDILAVEPHLGLRVRDRLTHEERFVIEPRLTSALTPRCGMLARIVDYQGTSMLCGLNPTPLPAWAFELAEQLARKDLGEGRVEPERLREAEVVLRLVGGWQGLCVAIQNKPEPRICNTDGEPVLHCTDVFAYEREREADVVAALSALDGCLHHALVFDPKRPQVKSYALYRQGNKVHLDWETTILAVLEIDARAARVTVTTNSEARADRFRAAVEVAGKATPLTYKGRRATPPSNHVVDGVLGVIAAHDRVAAVPKVVAVPSDDQVADVRTSKEKYFAAWFEARLPVLGDQTPREAAKTHEGRLRLRGLLRELEYLEGRSPEWERIDVRAIRRELGVED